MEGLKTTESASWYVMRDLRRPNAKRPAYLQLQEAGVSVFTPMTSKMYVRKGVRHFVQVPVMMDLLFAHDTRARLDHVVSRIALLQYRWQRGSYRQAITVPEADMQRFITAVTSTPAVSYYRPDEIIPSMYGKMIRIIGGPLDGYEVPLLKRRGMRNRHIIVQIDSFLTATVEVEPEYIQLL